MAKRNQETNTKTNPPLSEASIERLHKLYRDGAVGLTDVLNEVCQDPNCPDLDDEKED